jgi:DHA1 family bicyclomycin/chloramphenicol resistance-like MFS transporter
LLREPLYIAYTVVGASTVGTYYLFISGAPYVVMDVIGHTPTEYGTYTLTLSAAYFIGNLISVRESSRFGHTRMVVAGSAMALLGAAAMIPMLEWFGWHIESLFAPMAVATIAAGLLIPNAQAGALAVASGGSGAASSLMGFFQQAFGAIMIQTLGLLTLASPMPMAWLMVLMSAVAMVATVYVLRHRGVT